MLEKNSQRNGMRAIRIFRLKITVPFDLKRKSVPMFFLIHLIEGLLKSHPKIQQNNLSRNVNYLRFLVDFYLGVPDNLQRHRYYYSQNQRGFGEDAFHAAWFRLFEGNKPINCLEIGVYRGQTISLWALLA